MKERAQKHIVMIISYGRELKANVPTAINIYDTKKLFSA